MKTLIIMLIVGIFTVSCNKAVEKKDAKKEDIIKKESPVKQDILSPRSHCEKGVDHVISLMFKDPKVTEEKKEKLKEEVKLKREKSIIECVRVYKKEQVECVLASLNLKELKKCKNMSSVRSNLRPRDHCIEAIEHVEAIMLKDPKVKKMTKENFDKMKKSFDDTKEKGISDCVEKYDREAVSCIASIHNINEINNCSPKKKKH